MNSIEGIEQILNNIEDAVKSDSCDALKKMIEGSYNAGRAINITKTTAPHALSYTLTSAFNIPHGHAVAILLGKIATVTFRSSNERIRKRFVELFGYFECSDESEFESKWYALMKSCDLVPTLDLLGVCVDDVSKIAKEVNIERLKGHPITLDSMKIHQIIETAIH